MPFKAPFTRMCQAVSALGEHGKADLHVHSTASDGMYSPQEVVAIARQTGLSAVAIADHDTLEGYQQIKNAIGIEIIAGVEISAEFEGRDLHLLGYLVDPDHAELAAALAQLRGQRRERFYAAAGRLRRAGASIEDSDLRMLRESSSTLGRRHLARLLIESKQAGSYFDAFARYLNKPEIMELPKARLPVGKVIELVRAAGGVASWAHPASDTTIEQMRRLRELGLMAVECEYPFAKASHGRKLRAMADELGLAITGGSDCHGPKPNNRAIGVKGINRADLDRMMEMR
jgi:3',5'-nucleoside bisphosphate phosphatase